MTVTVKSSAWPFKVKEYIDPQAVLNYGIDWTDWLPTDAAISTSTWVAVGGTVEHSTHADGIAYVWVSSGVVGSTITLTNHITLDTAPIALEDERTLILTVKDR